MIFSGDCLESQSVVGGRDRIRFGLNSGQQSADEIMNWIASQNQTVRKHPAMEINAA